MAGRRSEEASARRVRQAQRDGQVPGLADLRLVTWALALWLFARFVAGDVYLDLRGFLIQTLSAIAHPADAGDMLRQASERLATTLALPLLIFALAAALPALVRGALALPAHRGLRNPLAGLRSPQQGLALAMGAARWLLLLLLGLQVAADLAPGVRSLGLHPEPTGALPAVLSGARGLAYRVLVAVLLVAPAGLWLEQVLHRRGLRMTREERKREQLREELHPRMRGELRRRADTGGSPLPEATHVVPFGAQRLLLALDDSGQRAPRLVGRVGTHAAGATLPRLRVTPELAHRLAQLSPGDSVPRACYPPLARAVAALRDPSTESS